MHRSHTPVLTNLLVLMKTIKNDKKFHAYNSVPKVLRASQPLYRHGHEALQTAVIYKGYHT